MSERHVSADGSSYEGKSPFRPRKQAPLVGALPRLDQLAGYPKRNGRHDLIAGVTVAALAIPSAMAYAELAGLSPVAGPLRPPAPRRCETPSSGSSRQVAVGPEGAPAPRRLPVGSTRRRQPEYVRRSGRHVGPPGGSHRVGDALSVWAGWRIFQPVVLVGYLTAWRSCLVVDSWASCSVTRSLRRIRCRS